MCSASPSARRLASWKASPRVGWAWMVPPISSSRAPISSARPKAPASSETPAPTACDAEHQVVVGARRHAHEAVLGRQRQRPAVGLEGELRGQHLAAGLARLLGRQAGGDDLGIGEAHGRDHRAVEHAAVAGDDLGDHLALRHGAMREHRLAGEVADRPDVAHRRRAALVDLHEAAVHGEVERARGRSRRQPGAPAGGDEDLVGGDAARRAAAVSTRERHRLTRPAARVRRSERRRRAPSGGAPPGGSARRRRAAGCGPAPRSP